MRDDLSPGKKRHLLEAAHRIAEKLLADDCDPNELGKAIALLERHRSYDKARKILAALAENRDFHHSAKTREYVESVVAALDSLKEDKKTFQNESQMLFTLAWARRFLVAQRKINPPARPDPRGRP